jgi:hypothetical protein
VQCLRDCLSLLNQKSLTCLCSRMRLRACVRACERECIQVSFVMFAGLWMLLAKRPTRFLLFPYPLLLFASFHSSVISSLPTSQCWRGIQTGNMSNAPVHPHHHYHARVSAHTHTHTGSRRILKKFKLQPATEDCYSQFDPKTVISSSLLFCGTVNALATCTCCMN